MCVTEPVLAGAAAAALRAVAAPPPVLADAAAAALLAPAVLLPVRTRHAPVRPCVSSRRRTTARRALTAVSPRLEKLKLVSCLPSLPWCTKIRDLISSGVHFLPYMQNQQCSRSTPPCLYLSCSLY